MSSRYTLCGPVFSGRLERSYSAVFKAARSGSPARAAPAIPASLCISAATTFVRAVRWGKNFSDFLLMPPPTTMRSGQRRNSTLWRYSSRRLAYSSQLRSSLLRALSAARCSASLPLTSMCPNSVLGTSRPPTKREVPMPVPSVSIRTTPSCSLPAPQRISARPAASASLTTLTGESSSLRSASSRSKPIADLSMFAAVCTTPPLTTAGKPQPTGPCHPASRITSTVVSTIASGVAGLGVLILTLSLTSSPVSVSTGAPLIPEPPTSIPNTFMSPPQTDTPSFYTIRFLSLVVGYCRRVLTLVLRPAYHTNASQMEQESGKQTRRVVFIDAIQYDGGELSPWGSRPWKNKHRPCWH